MERERIREKECADSGAAPVTQRRKIERYYDTLIGQGSGALSPDIVTYMLLFIGMMLLFMPVQELIGEGEEGSLLSIVWCFTLLITMAVTFYMQKYHTVAYGNNKMETVAEKLLYMPIDRKENRKFLFGKLIGFLKKITIAGLIMQVGVALIAYHSVSIWNIIYILGLTFVTPLVFCGLPIVLRDIAPRR